MSWFCIGVWVKKQKHMSMFTRNFWISASKSVSANDMKKAAAFWKSDVAMRFHQMAEQRWIRSIHALCVCTVPLYHVMESEDTCQCSHAISKSRYQREMWNFLLKEWHCIAVSWNGWTKFNQVDSYMHMWIYHVMKKWKKHVNAHMQFQNLDIRKKCEVFLWKSDVAMQLHQMVEQRSIWTVTKQAGQRWFTFDKENRWKKLTQSGILDTCANIHLLIFN